MRERDEASAMSALPDTSGRARPDLARPPIEIDLTKTFAASAVVTVVVHFAADELLTGMAMDERTFRRGLTEWINWGDGGREGGGHRRGSWRKRRRGENCGDGIKDRNRGTQSRNPICA